MHTQFSLYSISKVSTDTAIVSTDSAIYLQILQPLVQTNKAQTNRRKARVGENTYSNVQ